MPRLGSLRELELNLTGSQLAMTSGTRDLSGYRALAEAVPKCEELQDVFLEEAEFSHQALPHMPMVNKTMQWIGTTTDRGMQLLTMMVLGLTHSRLLK